MQSRQANNFFWIIFAIGIALRIPLLNYSFFGDEWFSVVRDSHRLITNTEDRFRPLFFTLLYLWKQLGFTGEAGLRSLSLLFGVLQLPLAYLIGKRLRDETLGLLFTAVIAASPILIEFSQELRMYSMITLIGMLQFWLLLKLRDDRTLGVWLAFILTALAGVYTHIFYWLFLMGCALSLFRLRREIPLGRSVAATGAVLLLYLPNIPNVLDFLARRGSDYGIHFPSAIPKLAAAFTVGFNYFRLPELGPVRAIDASILADNALMLIPVLLICALVIWGLVRMHLRPHFENRFWLYDELFVIPVLLATIASAVTGKYFLQPKYLIFCVPPFLLLALEAVRILPKAWLRRIAAVFGIVLFVIAIHHYWHPRDYGRKENWKLAGRVLEKKLESTSAGKPVFMALGRLPHLEYYYPQLVESLYIIDPPKSALTPDDSETRLFWGRLPHASTFYYIDWETIQNTNDPGDHFMQTMRNLMVVAEVEQLNPRMSIYTFKVPVN